MRHKFLLLAAALVFSVGTAPAANAATILLDVDFDTENDGYTADADGAEFWGRRHISNTPFDDDDSSASGMIFYGIPDGSSHAPTITLDPVDLTNYTDIELRISLAATDDLWEEDHVDSVVISILSGSEVVDTFLPDRDNGADLESDLYGTDLDEDFRDYTYQLLGPFQNATSFQIQIGAFGTSGSERIGIDSIQLAGTNPSAPMPEPTSALLFGVGGLLVGRSILRISRIH